ncbi:MAG: hypothetical protein GXX85_10930 [Ignavibacteria bacterium]|nr:hypothetical protein [Ignavibacteria bacterium]
MLGKIGFGCDEAAINAIMKSKFSPGLKNGNPVKTQIVIPVFFKIN